VEGGFRSATDAAGAPAGQLRFVTLVIAEFRLMRGGRHGGVHSGCGSGDRMPGFTAGYGAVGVIAAAGSGRR